MRTLRLRSSSRRRAAAVRSDDRARRLLRWLFSLHGSPEAVAGGVAIGVLVALSPTVGVQSALAAVLATLWSANRPAALALVWLTNPLTIPPIFAMTYAVGAWLLPGGPPVQPNPAITGSLAGVGALAGDLIARMVVGGLVLGSVLAAAAYAVTLRLVRAYRHRGGDRSEYMRRPTAPPSSDCRYAA